MSKKNVFSLDHLLKRVPYFTKIFLEKIKEVGIKAHIHFSENIVFEKNAFTDVLNIEPQKHDFRIRLLF